MASLKEEAQNFKAPKLKNIAELNAISVDMEVQEEKDCEFPYKFIMVDGERYKIANSVLADMKEILSASPNIKSFKVIKKGEGIKTNYTLIPLQ